MLQRAGLACLGVLVAIGATACGGGGGGTSGYTLSATQSCLEKAGFQTSVVKNRYLPGTEGNLRVRLTNRPHLLAPNAPPGSGPTDEYVFLVFGKDSAAALATQNKAVALAIRSFETQGLSITRTAAKRGIGLTKNVFYYSAAGALTQSERTKVAACLR